MKSPPAGTTRSPTDPVEYVSSSGAETEPDSPHTPQAEHDAAEHGGAMSFEHCDRFHSSMGQHYRVYYADPLGLRREAGLPRTENGLPPTLRRRLRRLFATLDFRNASRPVRTPNGSPTTCSAYNRQPGASPSRHLRG